ncbi:MAG: hypothetical protein ACYTGZ_01575 [Planctomycetota bacterium]
MRKPVKIAMRAGVVGLLAMAVILVVRPLLVGPQLVKARESLDLTRLLRITSLLVRLEKPPLTSGGQLDVYRLLASDAEFDPVDLCKSARSKSGPTLDEIRAGDYRRFPYARINTPFDPRDEHETAVLWDASPQETGNRLVATDRGKARRIPENEFAAFLAAHAR